jgi:23S rRNA (adenine-N6)-dimethyltransferase
VEWGFAKRITACAPRDFETAWWQTRFEITIARKVSPRSFIPPPSVNSAHLVIRRRAFTQTHERRYWEQLRATYGLSSSAARRLVRPR